jgi:phage-related protein
MSSYTPIETLCMLHAFHKKTQKTRSEDIELAARRYKQLRNADG